MDPVKKKRKKAQVTNSTTTETPTISNSDSQLETHKDHFNLESYLLDFVVVPLDELSNDRGDLGV